MKVLLVDDNLDLLNILQENLDDLGAKCYTSSCSLSALEVLEKNPRIDIVFSDVKLPGLNGIELARTIKSMYKIPVVLTSGDFQFKETTVADRFVLKPYDIEEMYNTFKVILRNNNVVTQALHV